MEGGGEGGLFDYRKNEEILENLEVEPDDEKLRRYKSNWLQHVTRMDSNRMAKIVLNCRAKGTETVWKDFQETVG